MNRLVPNWVYLSGIALAIASVAFFSYQLGLQAQPLPPPPPAQTIVIPAGEFNEGMQEVGNVVFVLLAFVWLATVDWWRAFDHLRATARRRRIARIRLNRSIPSPALSGVIPDTGEGRE